MVKVTLPSRHGKNQNKDNQSSHNHGNKIKQHLTPDAAFLMFGQIKEMLNPFKYTTHINLTPLINNTKYALFGQHLKLHFYHISIIIYP